jgi:ATP-dependent helicase/DNAse subunit B
MLLLTGPPGSGKTRHVLDQVRNRLSGGRHGFRLLVPTATMAEHFRNELAREGFVFRAGVVSTLARFIEPWTEHCGPVSGALLDWLIQEALARAGRPEFRSVADLAGFRMALARSIRELSAAGCRARELSPLRSAAALQAVYAEVEAGAAARGLALDGQRLSKAAERIRRLGLPAIEEVFFDGFFSFTDPELDLIGALGSHSDLTVTLPSWQGAEDCRARLIAAGFQERTMPAVRPRPRLVLFKAATLDREMEEIAARVLESGRPFREIGIVMRSPDPCLPALRAALERFGIPARFYFASSLAAHPLARQLLSAVETRGGPAATAPEWGEQFHSLCASWRPPFPAEPEAHELALLWRASAAALRGFEDAVEETVSLFPHESRIPCAEFCRQLRASLRLASLRVPDHRRNVVHVMDVYEARQWELPVVFVCGLLERQFPLYHSPDPLLPDGLRRQLREHGVRVPAAEDQDQIERFLFELTTTRATDTLVLSYSEFNSKGDPNLRSFCLERFLEAAQGVREQSARRVRPAPRNNKPPEKRPVLRTAVPPASGPTELEEFLQCPFQFFAGRTLKLEGPAVAPERRLDASVQGKIAHEVLARWIRTREDISHVFEEVFQRTCAREGVPDGYRTEAVRLELLRHLRRFAGRAVVPGASPAETERDFTLVLEDGVTLGCRIDRIDLTPDGRALIIDYKYRSPETTRKLVKEHAEGTRVQGGIYMLAVKESGRQVAGMLFAGLRKEPAWEGWDTLGGGATPADLHQVMEQSRQTAMRAIQQIREGRIAPQPADQEFCQYCAYRDICRVESAAAVAAAGEAEQWI